MEGENPPSRNPNICVRCAGELDGPEGDLTVQLVSLSPESAGESAPSDSRDQISGNPS